ncbi:MAG: CdaR family protein [Thermoanaerobaculia bacterium]|nr:CdaR family protein [Thermoanaerobaculia bacterium]
MSESRTTLGLKLLALALAIAAWFFFSFAARERLSETTIESTVQYTPPADHTVLNQVERVRVRLRGPVSNMSSLNPLQVNPVVDLRNRNAGTVEVLLEPSNVVVPQGIEVVSIDPNILTLQIDRVVRELKPVDAVLSGEPAAGAIVRGTQVTPPAVLIAGPKSRLSQIPALNTSPVSLDGHALDFEESAAVVSPDPLVQVLQPVVMVRIQLDIPNTGDTEDPEATSP